MQIDIYELSQTRVDLMGYWLTFSLSIFLGLRLRNHCRIHIVPLLLVCLLIIYIFFVITLTKPSQSLIAFFISRYGIIMWFILGIGFAGFLDIIQKSQQTKYSKITRLITIGILIFLGTQVFSFARQYIAFPVQSMNYQAVASSASIFLLIVALTIETLWGGKKPLILSTAYLIVGTVLVVAIVLLQSTSIVVLWIGLAVVFFYKMLADSRFLVKLTLGIFTAIAIFYFLNSETFEVITQTTRFNVFFESEGEFSSLSSRLSIIDSFLYQFAVSPIFGHFEAEIVAGVGQGMYLHSLPLSFLTHTGIVGTTLLLVALTLFLRSRVIHQRGIDPIETQIARIMLVILALGSIATFLTWSVLWFMMGVLCRRPSIVCERY
ncbi:hypothetical protein [uncultured Thiothrix sp.]|uniref:hypothetical protein n=1 Tax=uncultured Thiothrix sp. TaxID=223185 RepID=UPI00261DA42C|nr:hypothetical protein [uncultured Thiothrix sp.]